MIVTFLTNKDQSVLNEQITQLTQKIPVINGDHQKHFLLEQADIDSTLTKEGKVADAKAAGDKINALTQEIDDLDNIVYGATNKQISPAWYQGILDPVSGVLNAKDTRIRTEYLQVPKRANSIVIDTASDYKVSYYCYTKDRKLIDYDFWIDRFPFELAINPDWDRIIVGMAYSDDAVITPDAASATTIAFSLTNPFSDYDKTKTRNTVLAASGAMKNAYYESDGSNGLYISIPGSLYIRGAYTYNFELKYVFSDRLTTSPLGVENCIHIPHNASLIFNVDSHDLEIVESLDTGDNIAIFKVGMGNAQNDTTDGVIGGIGLYFYLEWQISQCANKTSENSATDLPAYWTTEIDETVADAQEKMMGAGIDGESFLFITDLHWQNNVGYSPYITAELAKRLGITNVVLGGDYIGGGDKTTNALLMSDCLSGYREINSNLFPIFGNHDSNAIGAPSADHRFTNAGVYALMHNHLLDVNYGGYCYYSYDNELTKTRYIFLDTGLEGSALSADQKTWFEETLNSTPDGYKVLVFAHIIYQPTSWEEGFIDTLTRTDFMNTISALCDAFNASQSGREVVGIIGGHVHLDLSYATDGGIPIVLLDSDSKQTFSGSGSATGTINEQCVSVVTVDYTLRKIFVTRAGRGQDMEFTY